MQETNHQQHENDNNHDEQSQASLTTPLQVGCRWQPEHPHFYEETLKIKGWELHLLNADEFHSGNVAVLKRNGFNLVIDSGCDLVENLKKLTQTVDKGDDIKTFLINTHGHPDHTGGNSSLASDGATVISHQRARKAMIAYELVPDEGLPSITFRKKLNITLGNQRIKLIHLPSGHTDGDTAVWIPKLNVLHTGDPYMSHDYPLIDQRNQGSISDLIKTVSKLLKISNEETLIIPGHGDLSSRSDLIEYRYMLQRITSDVERMKAMGLSLRQIQEQKPTEDFDSRWEGDLITGDQFVSFIYDTLEDEISHIHSDSSESLEKSTSLGHATDDSDAGPWQLSFDASKIKTKPDRKGRLVFVFKGNSSTPISAVNNNNPQASAQSSVKQLAKHFDELTGSSFAESTLTYSDGDGVENVEFKTIDIKKKEQRLVIKTDMMERINELSMMHHAQPCASSEPECAPGHLLEQATFTINLPLIPGFE